MRTSRKERALGWSTRSRGFPANLFPPAPPVRRSSRWRGAPSAQRGARNRLQTRRMDVARFVDENSFSAPALQGKRAGGGLQQKSGLGLGGSKQQGSTVRRALGDISNRTKGADQQLQSGKQQQKQKDGQQLREGGASCAPAAPKAVTLVERAVAGPEHADADFGSPERFGRSLDEQREQQVEAEIEAAVTSVLSLRGTLPEDCYAEKPQVWADAFPGLFATSHSLSGCQVLRGRSPLNLHTRRRFARSSRRSSTRTPSRGSWFPRPRQSRQVRPLRPQRLDTRANSLSVRPRSDSLARCTSRSLCSARVSGVAPARPRLQTRPVRVVEYRRGRRLGSRVPVTHEHAFLLRV